MREKIRFMSIAICAERDREYLKEYFYKDGIWDFSALLEENTPVYIVDIDENHVMDSGTIGEDPITEYYEAVTEALTYVGVKVEEAYGILFTRDGDYMYTLDVLDALADGLVEEAQ